MTVSSASTFFRRSNPPLLRPQVVWPRLMYDPFDDDYNMDDHDPATSVGKFRPTSTLVLTDFLFQMVL